MFGTLYPIPLSEGIVLSVSSTHLVLVNIPKNKVLTYVTLEEKAEFHCWDKSGRSLTLLVKGEAGVIADTYRVQTLLESLQHLANTFELKKAVKMVNKYAAL